MLWGFGRLLSIAAVVWQPTVLARKVTPETLTQQSRIQAGGSDFVVSIHNTKFQTVFEANGSYPQSSSRLVNLRMAAPTVQDVLRYRYHHGMNLGSVFVLERWLSPKMFNGAPERSDGRHKSELYAVQQSIRNFGIDGTRQRFEEHWSNAITADDWQWLVNEAHCTTIRLPVGYFTLGPHFTSGTPFEGASQVYTNAWASVQRIVAAAYANGIGVLLDFHALPGGANGGDHSGTDSGRAELWGSDYNKNLAIRCIQFMVQQSANMPGVIGIQLVNEADFKAPQQGMYEWYDKVISSVKSLNPDIPLYISDAWNLNPAMTYAASRNKPSALSLRSNPIVIDTHKYYCFGEADKRKSPNQIISEIPNALSNVKDGNVFNDGAVSVVVFEYSTVLAESSWAQASASNRQNLARRFGNEESKAWQKVGGSAFWAFVSGSEGTGNGWSFKGQVTSGAIFPPNNLVLSTQDVASKIGYARQQKQSKKDSIYGSHVAYWNRVSPGKLFEHYRFASGWDQGFEDAAAFFSMRAQGSLGASASSSGGDKIGLLDLWVLKRMRESGESGALASFGWEWEQGFRQGVQAFYSLVGI